MDSPAKSSSTMKALQIVPSSCESVTCSIAYVSLPIPLPERGYALVKVHYSAIHPSDRLNSRGGFEKTTLPRIPGRDFSGSIIHSESLPSRTLVFGTGDATTGFTVDGTHAEYALVSEDICIQVPEGLDLRPAATLGVPYTTALRCLRRGHVAPTDTVLILGASGAVGSAAVQLCQALDCQSVLTASRREGNGVDLVLTMEPATLQSKMMKLTRSHGVNLVVDTIGDIGMMSMILGWLKARGRYVWIAAPRDGTAPFLSVDILQTYHKEIELIGCNSALNTASETKEELSILAALIQNGRLKPTEHTKLIELPLEDLIERGYVWREPGGAAVIQLI